MILGRVDGASSNVGTSRFDLEQPEARVVDSSLPLVRSAQVLSSIKHSELIEELHAFLVDEADAIAEPKAIHAVEDGVAIN